MRRRVSAISRRRVSALTSAGLRGLRVEFLLVAHGCPYAERLCHWPAPTQVKSAVLFPRMTAGAFAPSVSIFSPNAGKTWIVTGVALTTVCCVPAVADGRTTLSCGPADVTRAGLPVIAVAFPGLRPHGPLCCLEPPPCLLQKLGRSQSNMSERRITLQHISLFRLVIRLKTLLKLNCANLRWLTAAHEILQNMSVMLSLC